MQALLVSDAMFDHSRPRRWSGRRPPVWFKACLPTAGRGIPRCSDLVPGESGHDLFRARLVAWYRVNVKQLTPMLPQKQRSTSAGTLVGTRFQPALLAAIDEWRKEQPDLPTRPEAVRRLVEVGLRQAEERASVRAEIGLPANSDRRGGQT